VATPKTDNVAAAVKLAVAEKHMMILLQFLCRCIASSIVDASSRQLLLAIAFGGVRAIAKSIQAGKPDWDAP
jgi:hypothetical protein